MWTNKQKNWVNDMLYNSVIDWCYTFPCAFLRLLFNFNSRWVIYLFHTMFLSLFTSRIRHRFLRVYEKLFAEDIFRIYDNFSPLRGKKTAISKHDNADHGELSTNQSLVIVYFLRGAKIPFLGAKIPLGEQ